jgi:hypothetical protein
MRGRSDEAYRQLRAAEQLNPEGLPHDMMARELARGLLCAVRAAAVRVTGVGRPAAGCRLSYAGST